MSEELERVKKVLNQQHEWPTVFMFKFVVPNDNVKVARVEGLFNSETAEIRTKASTKGNYISLTIREVMTSADSVLAIYKEAKEIDGLIAL